MQKYQHWWRRTQDTNLGHRNVFVIKAGQESFKSITRSYYKGSIAAFLVFDISRRDSFTNLSKWIYEVKNYSHADIQIVLVGNKSDLNSK